MGYRDTLDAEEKKWEDKRELLMQEIPVHFPDAVFKPNTYGLANQGRYEIGDVKLRVDIRRTGSSYFRRPESLQLEVLANYGYNIKAKIFPLKKDGTFSWDKIKEEIEYRNRCIAKAIERKTQEANIHEVNKSLIDFEFPKGYGCIYPSTRTEGLVEVSWTRKHLSIDKARRLAQFLKELDNEAGDDQ